MYVRSMIDVIMRAWAESKRIHIYRIYPDTLKREGDMLCVVSNELKVKASSDHTRYYCRDHIDPTSHQQDSVRVYIL